MLQMGSQLSLDSMVEASTTFLDAWQEVSLLEG